MEQIIAKSEAGNSNSIWSVWVHSQKQSTLESASSQGLQTGSFTITGRGLICLIYGCCTTMLTNVWSVRCVSKYPLLKPCCTSPNQSWEKLSAKSHDWCKPSFLKPFRLFKGRARKPARKPDLIKALDKWIQNERKKSKCSNSDVSELPLDKELKKPLALVAVGSDLLMVSDVAACGVYQAAITNNGACLKGTVTLVMKLPETSEPVGLACDDSQLYVADAEKVE